MKKLLISDTHGKIDLLEGIIERRISEIDTVLFMGDGENEILNASYDFKGLTFYGVAGNNDFFSKYPLERTLTLEGLKIYMTHGQLWAHKGREHFVAAQARNQGASLALFGHTHIPYKKEHLGILAVNPGSIYIAKGGFLRTYAMMEIRNGLPTFEFFSAQTDEVVLI